MALPAVVLVPPPLVLLVRAARTCTASAGCRPVLLAALGLATLLAPAAAVWVARVVAADRAPAWLAPRPDDRTLAVLVGIVGGLALYLVAAALGAVPGWMGRLLDPFALVLALPLAIVQGGLVGSTETFGPYSPMVRRAIVAAGTALSGAWWYVLAKTVARWLDRVNEPRD